MPYCSPIGIMPIIDHNNAHKFIDPRVDGIVRRCAMLPRDQQRHPDGNCGFAALRPLKPFSKSEIIAQIKQRDEERSGLRHILGPQGMNIPVKDQGPILYCWIYSTVDTQQIMSATQGDGYVALSATAAGTMITGGRNRGGYGAEAIEFLAQHGTCLESEWREHQINLRLRTPAVLESCKRHRLEQWGELPRGDLNQLATAVLLNIPVTIGLNWWGHQVTIIDVVLLAGGVIGFVFRNSWGTRWGDNGYGVLTPEKARGDMFYPISVLPRDETADSRTREYRLAG